MAETATFLLKLQILVFCIAAQSYRGVVQFGQNAWFGTKRSHVRIVSPRPVKLNQKFFDKNKNFWYNIYRKELDKRTAKYQLSKYLSKRKYLTILGENILCGFQTLFHMEISYAQTIILVVAMLENNTTRGGTHASCLGFSFQFPFHRLRGYLTFKPYFLLKG